MAITTNINLAAGQRAQRKMLVTVAAWGTPATTGGVEPNREILGVRTEDSSIEFNPDVATSTDICGITYTDVNKTEPQQSFDPYYIIGGTDHPLAKYLTEAALRNNIDNYNGVFTIYIITAFMDDGDTSDPEYFAVKHTGCSIIPQSIGGDSYTNMPIEVHLSNNITVGTVDTLASTFTFTEET